MRTIDTHHDGLGTNDLITIECDDTDPQGGGASHLYTVTMVVDGMKKEVARIQFQRGPRSAPTSSPGVTDNALLAIVRDRFECFQAGPFSCRENAIQLTKIEETMLWNESRARARAKRGVLGKNIK